MSTRKAKQKLALKVLNTQTAEEQKLKVVTFLEAMLVWAKEEEEKLLAELKQEPPAKVIRYRGRERKTCE